MEGSLRDPPAEGDGTIPADGDGARGAAASSDGKDTGGDDSSVAPAPALALAAASSSPPSSSASSARLAAVVAEACSLLGGADAAADLLRQALESLRPGSPPSSGGGGPGPARGDRHRRHRHAHDRLEEQPRATSHALRQRHLIDSSDGSDGRALLMRAPGGYQGGTGGYRGRRGHGRGSGVGSGGVASSDGGGGAGGRCPSLSILRVVGAGGGGGGGSSGHGGSTSPLSAAAEALLPRTAAAAAAAAAAAETAAAPPTHHSRAAARANWQRALAAALAASRCGGYPSDPWADRRIPLLCPARLALRHRYDAGAARWTVDTVLVKVEAAPFAAGAMRSCLRLKKLSAAIRARGSGIKPLDWKSAPNFVAKVFKKPGVPDSAYFDDVKLQMDAKRLCEAYNRSVPPPPKQIDMLSAAVLQIQRPALPPGLGSISETGTCLVEPLVPGEYVKHSSNLGYVDESKRLTPRCFSHFTFEATGGEAMVVDIQGVGDVLTDPQIHTADGRGYGDGNLGARGMAAFFLSHECSGLCSRLGLQEFARCHEDADAAAAAAAAAPLPRLGTSVVQGGGQGRGKAPAAAAAAAAPPPPPAAAAAAAAPAAPNAAALAASAARARALSRARTLVPKGGGGRRGNSSSSSSSGSGSSSSRSSDGDDGGDGGNGTGRRGGLGPSGLYSSAPPDRPTLLSALFGAAPSGLPHPHGPLHYAAARLHGETLALAELLFAGDGGGREARAAAAAAAARAGNFHLRLSAAQGFPQALGAIARGAAGVPPTSALVAGLVKAAADEEKRERERQARRRKRKKGGDADDQDDDEDEDEDEDDDNDDDGDEEKEESQQLALLNDDVAAAAAAAAARVGCRAAAAVAAAAAASRGDRATEGRFLEVATSDARRYLAEAISEGLEAAEEEFQALDGGGRSRAELLAALAEARLELRTEAKAKAKAAAAAAAGGGDTSFPPSFGDERTPAQLLEEAAEAAEHDGKGKLAARYYERAAAVEEEDDEEGGGEEDEKGE